MKKAASIGVIVLAATLCSGAVFSENRPRFTSDSDEKVCALGVVAQTEQGLLEALQGCKRGDIIETGWVKITVATQLCDFTKTIVYHPPTGAIAACVYTGKRRMSSK